MDIGLLLWPLFVKVSLADLSNASILAGRLPLLFFDDEDSFRVYIDYIHCSMCCSFAAKLCQNCESKITALLVYKCT
jgi:hypothetical protein